MVQEGHLGALEALLVPLEQAYALDTSILQPVKEHLQNGPGHGADLVPNDDAGDTLLANPFRCPLSLTTPAKEAVIGLGLSNAMMASRTLRDFRRPFSCVL